MKKSKLFLGAAAFVLAVGGVLATKANKKFTVVSQGTFFHAGVQIGKITNLTTSFNTISTGRATVVMATAGLTKKIATLFTGVTTSSKLVYHN